MKEFEKWLDKKSYSQAEERIAEATWIAALRWAIEEETWQGTDEGGSWGISRENIEEELDAKT